jgi:hypothetical protein
MAPVLQQENGLLIQEIKTPFVERHKLLPFLENRFPNTDGKSKFKVYVSNPVR